MSRTISGLVLLTAMPLMAALDPIRQGSSAELFQAIGAGDLAAVRRALEAGADSSARNYKGECALLVAASGDRADIVALLLDRGAKIGEVSGDAKFTPVWGAAMAGATAAFDILVERGANWREPNRWGFPLLGEASHGGKSGIVRRLLELGADPNGTTKRGTTHIERGDTALHRAAWPSGNDIKQLEPVLESIEMLAAKGADPNARNAEGQTPLHVAAGMIGTYDEECQLAICQKLIGLGADLNARDNEGRTPLHRALDWPWLAIAATLVLHGAKLDVKDGQGLTPTDFGVLLTRYESFGQDYRRVARTLLELGGRPSNVIRVQTKPIQISLGQRLTVRPAESGETRIEFSEDRYVRKGIVTLDGIGFGIYLPPGPYSTSNPGGRYEFANASTRLAIDNDRNSKIGPDEVWFADGPIRIGNRMVLITAFGEDGAWLEVAPLPEVGRDENWRLKPRKEPPIGFALGRPSPEFELEDLEDRSRKLTDAAGRYLLLDFWSPT